MYLFALRTPGGTTIFRPEDAGFLRPRFLFLNERKVFIMKKIVSLVLVLVFILLSMTACGSSSIERNDIKKVVHSVGFDPIASSVVPLYFYEVESEAGLGYAFSYEKMEKDDTFSAYVISLKANADCKVKSCVRAYKIELEELSETYILTYYYQYEHPLDSRVYENKDDAIEAVRLEKRSYEFRKELLGYIEYYN